MDAYQPLREDLILTSHASYVLELLDRFTYADEMENSAIFRLLTDTLSRLAAKTDPWLVIRYYEIRLLDHLGFRPQLFSAPIADARSSPKINSSRLRGWSDLSALCAGVAQFAKISVEALKYLRHFQRSSYADATRARPDLDVQKESGESDAGIFHLFTGT